MGSSESVRNARESKSGDDLYSMEVGLLKERAIEVVKITPMLLKHTVWLFLMAMKSLGKSREEIEKELNTMMVEARARTTAGLEKANERFARNSAHRKSEPSK